jgi:hypothetical protein
MFLWDHNDHRAEPYNGKSYFSQHPAQFAVKQCWASVRGSLPTVYQRYDIVAERDLAEAVARYAGRRPISTAATRDSKE